MTLFPLSCPPMADLHMLPGFFLPYHQDKLKGEIKKTLPWEGCLNRENFGFYSGPLSPPRAMEMTF